MKSGRVIGAVAMAASLGVAGCGGDTQSGQSGSAGNKPSASSAHLKLTTATFLPATKKAFAGQVTMRMSVHMRIGEDTITAAGVAKVGRQGMAMSMKMKLPNIDGEMRLILLNRVLYLSIPGQMPAGKYLKVTADSDDPLAQSLRPALESMDPRKTFDAFEAGLKKVKYVSSDNGLARYKVTVDTRAALKPQGQALPNGLPKTLDYDMWVDQAELLRRTSFSLKGVTVVANVSDYGKPVTIKAPPASAIIS